MKYAGHIEGLAAAGSRVAGPVHLAIGMFDGVHLGHHAVADATVHSARRAGGTALALTFDPHPSRLLRPEHAVRLMQPLTRRVAALQRAGFAGVIVEPFVSAFAAIEADAFLPHLQQSLPGLAALYVGENWRYGRGRTGDIRSLIAAGRAAGVTVVSAPRINFNGDPISSTRIRECLESGRLADANAMLGYTYGCDGVITPGRQLGRTLGFPTLNLAWAPECGPRFGVYLVRIRSAMTETSWQPGVANYGLRPTVELAGVEPRLEVHVLAPTELDAGSAVEVEWLDFVRPEERFADVEALRRQVGQDVARARAWWSGAGRTPGGAGGV